MYKQRIILFFSIVLFSFLLLITTLFFCIAHDFHLPMSYWIKEAINIKEHVSNAIAKPKILIVSGSNSLYGICSPLLKEKINKEIVNFGFTYVMPLEFYFGIIKNNAKPNDIVIMPLEYKFYTRDNSFSIHQIKNLTTWGTEYIKEFSTDQIFKLLFQSLVTIPERLTNSTIEFPIRTYKEYMEDKKTSALLTKKFFVDDSINCFGDLLVDHKRVLRDDYTDSNFNEADFLNFRFQQLKKALDHYLFRDYG